MMKMSSVKPYRGVTAPFSVSALAASALMIFSFGCDMLTKSEDSPGIPETELSKSRATTVNLTKNPYANVNWSTFVQYKGNFHTHTTNSDGSQSPATVINEYSSKGYKILAITDHNYTTWPWPSNPGMLAVKGDEFSNSHHMNAFFNYSLTSTTLESGIPNVQSNGGISRSITRAERTFPPTGRGTFRGSEIIQPVLPLKSIIRVTDIPMTENSGTISTRIFFRQQEKWRGVFPMMINMQQAIFTAISVSC